MVHVSHFLSVFLTKEMVWDNMNTMNKKGGGGILLRRGLPFNVEKRTQLISPQSIMGKSMRKKDRDE